MHKLWFVMPAHGRPAMTRVCLRQLRRTCDALASKNIEASAVVIADDENLQTATELGFGTVRRDNRFLSRKFNDGFQIACDPRFNPRPADFVVPFGSDDWIDADALTLLPGPESVVCFRNAAFVDETGRTIIAREIDYEGGVGIRIYPRQLLARLGYRPADEDRERACDTSILVNLKRALRETRQEVRVVYADQHPYQIVDWKSAGVQLNAYSEIANRFMRGTSHDDPFEALTGTYPAEALDEMRRLYGR